VAPDAPDVLVLNQNYDAGWKARRRDVTGGLDVLPARRTADGLVGIDVTPQHREVEFYYLPDALGPSAAVSGATLVACLVVLWRSRGSAAASARQTNGV